MNTMRKPSTGDPVLDAYIHAIVEAFGSEPWADAEFYAEKVWSECCGSDGPEWAMVKDQIRPYWSK